MKTIEVTGVVSAPAVVDWLESFNLEAPEPGAASEVATFLAAGWVLPRLPQTVTIEVVHGSDVICQLIANQERPDVAHQHGDEAGARARGFTGWVSAIGLPTDCDLLVRAVTDAGQEATLAFVRIHRSELRSSFRPELRPLLVTMLGRTGSTWVMHLLRQHRSIVVHDSQHYETRAISYWMHMYKVLSEPENQAYRDEPAGHFHITDDPTVRRWFGDSYLKQVATFCQASIENLYLELLPADQSRNAVYFAEKCRPDHVPRIVWELYPGAREIVLVRDFRDIFCSIRAINAKRGFLDFGRGLFKTDEDYLWHLGREARLLLEGWRERSEQSFLLRYEDLILDPVDTIGQLLAYLELDAKPSIIDGLLRRGARADAELEWHRTTVNPAASVGRWRSDLDGSLASLADEVFGEALSAFGYEQASGSAQTAPRPSLVD